MKGCPEHFKAPFITREKAWSEAEKVRKGFWPEGCVPVDVESVVYRLGLKLEPIHELKQAGDIDALLRGDGTTIIVDADEYMDARMENRIRYSIAHELGHFVLHRDIYPGPFETLGEWVDFTERLPKDQWNFIEQHAYEFAGRLLVPREDLEAALGEVVGMAESRGFQDWDQSGDTAKDYLASRICRGFGVSGEVIAKRLTREGLWPPRR